MAVTTRGSMEKRSSLELMLDKIRQMEEDPHQPKDVLPELPVRPVSRARLPSAKRMPSIFFECETKEGRADFAMEDDSADFDVVIESSQYDHLLMKIEAMDESLEEVARGGSHGRDADLERVAIYLQSFVRGENARKDFEQMGKRLRAAVLIQKHNRKFKLRAAYMNLQSGCRLSRMQKPDIETTCEPESKKHGSDDSRNKDSDAFLMKVPYAILVDLQIRVLRTEAKIKEKKEENTELKKQLQEMEKKWEQYEEKMKCMEIAWQDQLAYLQKCVRADKENGAGGTEFRRCESLQEHFKRDKFDALELDEDGDESRGGKEQACHSSCPEEELKKLKTRFKVWTKEYKNKRRLVKKSCHCETVNGLKHWWGRF